MRLRRFDLLLIKGKTIMGRVIEKVTRSPYSHVVHTHPACTSGAASCRDQSLPRH